MIRRQHPIYFLTAAAFVVIVLIGAFSLMKTALPSADVIARQDANRPTIKVSDFSPGQVKKMSLNGHHVLAWRRSEAEIALALRQNDPADWRFSTSRILGQADAVFADDTNLTLGNEWLFVSMDFPSPYRYLLPMLGDAAGFFEIRLAVHYDLAGRARKGIASANLTIIAAKYIDDGQRIQLALDGQP